MKFGGRLAQRNFLYIFAWLCATVVPLLLQLMAGLIEEVRDYLAYYYNDISLYMFFAMTYGFASVFVSYYIVGGYRLAGTLDVLRMTRVKPWEITTGVIYAILKVIVPPMIVFVVGFGAYLMLFTRDNMISNQPWWILTGMAILVMVNMVILSMIPCLGIFRRISLLALLGVVLVLPLNALPVLLVFVLKWPVWAYSLVMLLAVAALYAGSVTLVARTWPAQPKPLE